jgi:hypothetical protein
VDGSTNHGGVFVGSDAANVAVHAGGDAMMKIKSFKFKPSAKFTTTAHGSLRWVGRVYTRHVIVVIETYSVDGGFENNYEIYVHPRIHRTTTYKEQSERSFVLTAIRFAKLAAKGKV